MTSDPNQSLNVSLSIDGAVKNLSLAVIYNEIAGYWTMDISDQSGTLLVSGIPLVTGYWPASNLLAPYSYLQIGSAYLICKSAAQMIAAQEDYPSWQPGNHELGTDFVLLWDDTVL